MTKPTEARQDELAAIREKIAQQFFFKKYPPSNDTLAYNYRWRDIPFDGCESSKPFYNEADQILSLTVSSGGICPECKGECEVKVNTGRFGLYETCLTCNGTGQKQPKTVGEIISEYLSS